MVLDIESENALRVPTLKRRVLALSIDGLILAVVGAIIGYSFIDTIVSLGGWGRLVGFTIAFTYFTILNSKIGNGQTIGKRILKIRVLQINGNYAQLKQSALRSFTLLTPYFLNGAAIDTIKIGTVLNVIISFAVFGVGISIIYLVLATKYLRQGTHDLVASTIVVNNNVNEFNSIPKVKGIHKYIVIAILSISALLPFIAQSVMEINDLGYLQKMYSTVGIISQSSNVGINDNTSTMNGKTTKSLIISVHSKFSPNQNDSLTNKFVNKIATSIFSEFPEARQRDYMNIVVIYGFDLGIYSSKISTNFNYTIKQWLDRIK